ncbi:hypothetical protein HAX54_015799, partial [Datura stramonium]|nr:hypothetical protein [Datura stramonium]
MTLVVNSRRNRTASLRGYKFLTSYDTSYSEYIDRLRSHDDAITYKSYKALLELR